MQIQRHPGGDRMAPGDFCVVPDGEGDRAEQGAARGVELAGDGDLRLPEAAAAGPRVVRIAQQQAAAVRRRRAVEGDRVGTHVGAVLGEQRADGVDGGAARGPVRGSAPRRAARVRRPGGRDAVHHPSLAAEYGQRKGAPGHIEGAHRTDPGGTRAGRILDVVLSQPGVVPGRPAAHQLLDRAARAGRRGLPQQLLDRAGPPDPREVQVAGEIAGRGGQRLVGRGVRTEVPGPLAPYGHEPVGQGARLVGRLCPPLAETEPGVVLGDDVRDAVLGVADRGGRPAARRMRGGGHGAGRQRSGGGRQGHPGEHKSSETVAHDSSQRT